MQMDAENMQKEFDKINKKAGVTSVKASTSDADFEELIKQHKSKLKNK